MIHLLGKSPEWLKIFLKPVKQRLVCKSAKQREPKWALLWLILLSESSAQLFLSWLLELSLKITKSSLYFKASMSISQISETMSVTECYF